MAKIKYGLSRIHIAKRVEAENGSVTYSTPIALPGAVSMSVEKTENETSFYADNVVFFSARAKTSEGGDLEITDVPKQIMLDYLGYKTASDGGIVETNDLAVGKFAMIFQIETDLGARIVTLYNCTMSEGSESYNTIEEDVSVQTSTLTITATGETVGAYQVFKRVLEKGDAGYDTAFTSVAVPTLA